MALRHNLLRASLCLLLLSFLGTGAFAQIRINKYIITTPTLTWADLSTNGGTLFYNGEWRYYSGDLGISLPFAFVYDGTTVAAGTTLYLNGGNISFGYANNSDYVSQGGLGSSSYPAMLCPFAGERMCVGSRYYSNNGIWTQVAGSVGSRVFTIQLNNVHGPCPTRSNSTNAASSIQIKLFEGTNVIQFIYQRHNVDLALECGSYYYGYTGLNGFTSPSFLSVNETSSGSAYSPTSDYQFSPVPPAELSLSPKTLNFGGTTPGNPITMCVQASSVGAANTNLHITGMNIVGASYFTIVSGPPVGTAIPQGSSVQYCIQFLPQSGGAQSATFTLQTDGADSGTQQVQLNGVGNVPAVSYSATSMFRGVNVEVDSTSATQYLYVRSTGTAPLTIFNVTMIGLDARAYKVVHLPQPSIPIGGIDSIGIKFSPDLEGVPDAKMVISSSGVNNLLDTVQFFGVGILPHLNLTSRLPNVVSFQNHVFVVNFDSVKVGYDSCLSITISNPGSDTLAIMQNYLSGKDFDFVLTPFTGTADTLLPPGDSAYMQVCFTPLQRGYRTATVALHSNIPVTQQTPPQDTSRFAIQFIGTGVPTGVLSVGGPNNGNVPVGTQMCVSDTLYNDGESDLTVTGLSVTGPNGTVFNATTSPAPPFAIAANGRKIVNVCATPDMMGSETATLTATGTSAGSATIDSLTLSVFGTMINDTVLVPTFLTVCQPGSDTETVTINNTGNVGEKYHIAAGGTNAADFKVLASTSDSAGGGGSATFKVVFTPSMGGTENAQLIVTGGILYGPISITGTGGAAVIAGDTSVDGMAGATTTFNVPVQNTGTCTWTPGENVVSDEPTIQYVSGSGGSTPIGPGSTGHLTFTYKPNVAGNNVAHITFPASVGTSTSTVVTINATAAQSGVTMVSAANGYILDQNYPNPVVDGMQTQALITLPESGNVKLVVIDPKGEIMQTVLDRFMGAGSYTISIDASSLASGAYYYRMMAGGNTLTRQMTVIK